MENDRGLADAARNYWVCSTRPDGRPHAIPVWGLWLDEVRWFSTDPRSYKARNLTANPEAVVHLESGDEVCVIEGTARRVAAQQLPGSFAAEYQLKYEIELDLSNENFGFYLFAPRVALGWIEADFPATATRWTFSP